MSAWPDVPRITTVSYDQTMRDAEAILRMADETRAAGELDVASVLYGHAQRAFSVAQIMARVRRQDKEGA